MATRPHNPQPSPWTRLPSLAALALLLACPSTNAPTLPAGPADPAKNLAQLDAFADRVQREAMISAWSSATQVHSSDIPKPFGILPLRLLTDEEVDALSARLADPQQQRCLQAIHATAVRVQSETDPRVMAAMAGIGVLRQEIRDLSQMFTDEGDMTRRKEQWLAQASVATRLAPLVRRVILARKQWAWQRSRLGYLELMQQHRGYDPAVVRGLESDVRRALASKIETRKSTGEAIDLRPPWAFEYINPSLSDRMSKRFDAAHCLERASSVFLLLGLPANPSALQVRNTKPGAFSSFAFYPIDPPSDQGITVRPGAGIVPHWSAFHEFGHAAMSLLTEPGSCRTARHPMSPAVSESCAKIAERLFYSEEWLQSQGVPPAEIALLREWERQSELMRMRSILADLELERALYRDPRGNVMREYIEIERRTAGVQMSAEFPSWALKRHLAYEPLARVDYLLARCGQAAVYRRLRQLPGGLLGGPARQFLREQVFRNASAERYEDWFRRAVGTEPNCSAWLKDVANQN